MQVVNDRKIGSLPNTVDRLEMEGNCAPFSIYRGNHKETCQNRWSQDYIKNLETEVKSEKIDCIKYNYNIDK